VLQADTIILKNSAHGRSKWDHDDEGYSEEAIVMKHKVYNDDDDDDDDDETWDASLCDITHSRGLLNIFLPNIA